MKYFICSLGIVLSLANLRCASANVDNLCDAIEQNNNKKANELFEKYQSITRNVSLNSLLTTVDCFTNIVPDPNPLISEPPQFKYELMINMNSYTLHFYQKKTIWQIAMIHKKE